MLARKGRLKAIKISRDWLTTREAVLEYVKNQAAKHQRILSSLENVSFGSRGGLQVNSVERVMGHHKKDGKQKSDIKRAAAGGLI